ncbi:integrase, catalytic region, zinc finger, CCHC-type containing protein [Tanacetum coccineum]
MFYTSQEEIALNAFCRDQVKPLLNELLDHFDGFQNLFQRDIKEMKDAFEQNDVYLDEIERQNDLLTDQLLEASLKHDIELWLVYLLHVFEKTYAYGAIRAENQNLLVTISELKARMKNGMNATSSVKRPKSRDSHVKTSVLDVSKNEAKKEAVYVLIPKSSETTFVAPKTRFSEKATQSKTLDTTSVASKSKIDEASASKARDKVVQIVLWIVDSCCSKHMTIDRSQLRNFVEKFIGTVRFDNDNIAAITGYGDYTHGNITICPVYYVEVLGHNLFSVGQFFDGDLEVAFHSKTCYVRNLEGDDLLTGGRDSNLYTISISDMAASSPICLMSKATSTKSWLWHRRLSHLNFGTINDLTKLDLVDRLPKFKYEKDHLCSACERGKSKKASHPPKLIPSDYSKLELLHMDLCGPMRVASVNGKKYILVIVDDFSRFTWVYFLRSKDETPEIIKKFIAQAQLNYKAKVCKIRTDNGTEFKNATLKAHYEKLGIMQQFSIARTPQQNRVVKRHNRTLVEAARTMLIFLRLPEFLWAEAVATTYDLMNTPSKEDLDNLFGPMFEDYFEKKSSDTIINSAAQLTHDQEDSPSTSSIIVDILLLSQHFTNKLLQSLYKSLVNSIKKILLILMVIHSLFHMIL